MDYGGIDGEQEVLNIINEGGAHDGGADDGGGDDGSQFLNDSGEGMELENVEGLELQTSTDCDENVGPLTKSGELY